MTGKEYVDAVMKEIQESNVHEFTPKDLLTFKGVAQWYQNHCVDAFENYELFEIGTGKEYGETIERLIIESFVDLRKSDTDKYDAETTDQLHDHIEIKSIRAVKKDDANVFVPLVKRMVEKTDSHSFGSFQQVKPKLCKWFIFHVLYGRGERLFVVPSCMISAKPGKNNQMPGKFPLSKQHRGHKDEGQISHGSIKKKKYACLFEVPEYNHRHEDECTHAVKPKYVWRDIVNKISGELEKVGWKLPTAHKRMRK